MLFNENNKSKSTDGPPYYVNVDVTSGESLAIKLFDGNKKFVTGPASITMHSNCPYPPIPLPVNLPPGHMMQQIVDENGILKHIIISNSGDQMPKNQILTKNGAKLIPLNGTRLNSFKKKLPPSIDTFNNSKTNRFISTPNDGYNTTNLLNSNNLIYPFCCCCCPDCLNLTANNQLNITNSTSNYYLDNELNYGRSVSNFYPSSTNTTASKPISSNYPKRQFLNSTTPNNRNNRDIKSDNKNDNYNSINGNCLKTNNINNHLNNKNNKIINGKNSNVLNNKCNNLNYSSKNTLSANYPIKNALLSNKQICKQCVQQQQQYSFNQKYIYPSPTSYTSSSYNQNYQQQHHQQITNTTNTANSYQYMNNNNNSNNNGNKKPSTYASESTKQSLKNRASSSSTNRNSSTVLINSSPSLLNDKNQINNNNNNKQKDQNDCYSELIRYVNSNHISAFKSHKRIDATNLTNNKENNLLINNNKEPSSTTASSSPVSEHYDFSSEESDQITYKHTTLLNYPPSNCQSSNYSSQYLNNQSPNYTNNNNNYQSNYNHSNQNYLNNLSANSSTNSSLNSSTARKHNYQLKIRKSNCDNLQIDEKNNNQLLKIEKRTNDKTKLNIIENDEGIKLTNSDKDDGYEDDDFETKSCDNKSNDDDYHKDVELIKEQSSIDKNNLKEEEIDLKIDNQQIRSSEEMNKKNKQLDKQVNDNHILEHDKNNNEIEKDYNQNNESIENSSLNNECIKILNENLNEITIDEKLSSSSKIIESYLEEEEVDDRLEEDNYFNDLNIELNNNQKINQNEINSKSSIQINELNSSITNQENNISPNKQSKKKSDQNKIITFNLSYAKLTSNYVKLKWLVLNNGNNLYSCTKENPFMVEMIYSKDDKLNNDDLNSNKSSRIVYQGLVKHCKIQGLKPLTEYSFRVKYIINDQQLVSNLLTITTPETKPLINNTKKRSSKHNLSQLNLQQQQLLKQQILIEQKQKELQLQQQQHNQIVNKKSSDYSLIVILCAICTLFKDNFAYLLIIFFFISAIFSANYLSDVLN